ncbi:hypothetical protein BGY98DRAFT_995705 [Russula aff. rugulosa BPL654]|nr:hypothetical protein BGY98DRAFT_995705 [Russula aff. rugulosa BPL654]
MVVTSPHIRHCSSCNKCIMYPKRMYGLEIVCSGHSEKMQNCIGSNNYPHCVVFVLSHGFLHPLEGDFPLTDCISESFTVDIFLILTTLFFSMELFLPIGKAIIYKVPGLY